MWNETRSSEETRIQRQRQGFATAHLSTTEFFGHRDSDRKKSFRKEKPASMFRFFFKEIVQKGMLVIVGIHASVAARGFSYSSESGTENWK